MTKLKKKQIVTTPKNSNCDQNSKLNCDQTKKNQIVTKLKIQIVTVVIVTVLTVAVVTVVLGTFYSKNNLTPQQPMICSQCRFL